MSTVYAKQYGRLGNNLFQKAAAIGYAAKYNINYSLGRPKLNAHSNYTILSEVGHQYHELPHPTHNITLLDGYWQSERYFAHCREEVLKAFGYEWELHKQWCSIHVRRGDYLKYPDKHPVVTIEYLCAAMRAIEQRTGVTNFAVFSDDIAWCKDNFANLKWTFNYSESSPDVDLVLGSCCEHNIISNSSFSWWQAWLNQNPDKVVISPSKDNWFGPGNAHLDTSDLITDSWIQIKY